MERGSTWVFRCLSALHCHLRLGNLRAKGASPLGGASFCWGTSPRSAPGKRVPVPYRIPTHLPSLPFRPLIQIRACVVRLLCYGTHLTTSCFSSCIEGFCGVQDDFRNVYSVFPNKMSARSLLTEPKCICSSSSTAICPFRCAKHIFVSRATSTHAQ